MGLRIIHRSIDFCTTAELRIPGAYYTRGHAYTPILEGTLYLKFYSNVQVTYDPLTSFHIKRLINLHRHVAFSALTLLVGQQEGHPACKKRGDGGGGHWLVRIEWHPAGWSVCLPC